MPVSRRIEELNCLENKRVEVGWDNLSDAGSIPAASTIFMAKLFLLSPEFARLPGIKHAFFTRNLPGSNHVYVRHTFERLKLTGSPEELIKKNRDILIQNSPFQIQKLSVLDQEHSDRVVMAGGDTHADGQVTDQAGVALAVLTADCVPVLFADDKNRVIGSAHAGWKGATAGILENTVLEMKQLGAESSRITAVLGPCIVQEDYEVGPEFVDKLADQTRLKKGRGAQFLFDLPGYVHDRLEQLGLKQVLDIQVNTYRDKENCLSFRAALHQGRELAGNLVSVVMLDF